MAALVHLVRHADVDNPQHMVYGSLPGYGLSPYGLEQARRIGRYLGPRPVVAIWSSPLEPALRTAEEIASRSAVPVRVDEDLRDWAITDRWRGHRWGAIPGVFPGELETYLEDPSTVLFADETLQEVADRIADVARRLDRDHPHGDVVVVSHQDPVQAGRLRLVGSTLSRLHEGTPQAGTVITLRPGTTWLEETVWAPGESPGFGDRSELRLVSAVDGPQGPTSA
ncbi:MAG: histidine phosphatase family protein [Actinobacteria bacterium]|nr:histidine phosphatase family protein [Actinomycetota bacterium]